jgi:hypothetical protein
MNGAHSKVWHWRHQQLQAGKFGVTATYRYDKRLRTLVGRSRQHADAEARRRWGEWDGEPCYSTPLSIYYDVTGETQRRRVKKGMRTPWTL